MSVIDEIKQRTEYIYKLKDKKSELEQEVKELRQRIDEEMYVLNQLMEEEELEAIKIDGYTYTPTERASHSLKVDSAEAFLDWLEEHDPEKADIVRLSCNAKTFTSYIENAFKEGKEFPANGENGIEYNLFYKKTIQRRKSK